MTYNHNLATTLTLVSYEFLLLKLTSYVWFLKVLNMIYWQSYGNICSSILRPLRAPYSATFVLLSFVLWERLTVQTWERRRKVRNSISMLYRKIEKIITTFLLPKIVEGMLQKELLTTLTLKTKPLFFKRLFQICQEILLSWSLFFYCSFFLLLNKSESLDFTNFLQHWFLFVD